MLWIVLNFDTIGIWNNFETEKPELHDCVKWDIIAFIIHIRARCLRVLYLQQGLQLMQPYLRNQQLQQPQEKINNKRRQKHIINPYWPVEKHETTKRYKVNAGWKTTLNRVQK